MSADLAAPALSQSSPSHLMQETAVLLGAASELSMLTLEGSDQVPSAQHDEPCGLTPASLKHLKRQRDALAEDKTRLQAELSGVQMQLREQRQRICALEGEVEEFEARVTAMRDDVRRACAALEEQRARASELDLQNSGLKRALTEREAEIARLQEAVEQQRLLTKEVCEAAEQRMEDKTEDTSCLRDAQERIRQLEAEKEALLLQLRQQAVEHDDMKRSVAGAMAAAEKAIAMHAFHVQRVEQLRAAKLMEAINQKVELHISVPKVTLSYNDAPPLIVSASLGLSEGKIRDFLENGVFPHFEPLWVRLDGLDKAPDGSSKRAYSTKMLDRLTDAVKAFIMKSQQADQQASGDLSIASSSPPLQANASTGTSRPPGERNREAHHGACT